MKTVETILHRRICGLVKKVATDYRLNIDFDDLVNEAYLQTIEQGLELTFENISAKVRLISNESRNKYTRKNEKEIRQLQSKFCKKCNEDKPIAAFGVTSRSKTCKTVIQAYCNECISKVMKEYRKQNPDKFKVAVKKYKQSEKGISTRKKYQRSKKGMESNIERQRRYRKNKSAPI